MKETICAIDVGTTKVVALIAEMDDSGNLAIVGAGRTPAHGLRRGVVTNTVDAAASIGGAIEAAEASAGDARVIDAAYVGISGTHITAVGSRGAVAVGRAGRKVTLEDTQRALEQSRNIALPHNREIINAVPRTFSVDDQTDIQNPVGMFAYRLEVDASIITGASSALRNLVECVHGSNVEILDLVLEPLASAEAVLTEDERQLGVAVVDIGGGTTDLAIFLENAPWHTQVLDIGGDHFVRDVVAGLRMPYGKAEALIKQFGNALPDRVPADAEVRSGAFGQEPVQVVNRRDLAQILNARADELVEMILLEIKRSGYDGLLPAGVVITGGVAQLAGFGEMSRLYLDWPVRIGRPAGVDVRLEAKNMDFTSPEYATSVGLLLWGLRRGVGTGPRAVEPPRPPRTDRVSRFFRSLLPGPAA